MRIELKLRSPLPFPISPSVPFIALKTWKFSSQKDHGEQKKKKIVLCCLNILHFIRNWLESAMWNQFLFPGPPPESETDIR